jgi:cytoskeletal protein CcmA (bactofilin family)/Tfp pilus assembly protein PilX
MVRKKIRGRKGVALILSMIGLVVMLILGSSFMGRAINHLYDSSRKRNLAQAENVAESGIEMAITKLYEDYDGAATAVATAGSYSSTVSRPNGSAAYTIAANYSGIPNTVLIESVGTTWKGSRSKIRIIARYNPDVSNVFKGAIFSNAPLTLNGAGTVLPDASGEGGSIYANGNITFNGTSFTMSPSGYIYATGTTNWVPPQVPGTHVFQDMAPATMPVIDLDWYRNNATTVYTGDRNFNGNFSLSGIVFVDGDVRISGNYHGSAVIVATGRVRVTGNTLASDPAADALVLMSPRSISISGNSTVEGLVYSHNVDAEVTIGGSPTVVGALVADVVTTNGSITVQYSDVWSGLPLPGSGKTQWSQISWQRIW